MSVAWRLETIIFLEHVGLDVDAALEALCEEAGDRGLASGLDARDDDDLR
jgi:hypothetical protein